MNIPVVLALLTAAAAHCAQPVAAWLDPDKTEPEGTHYRSFPSKLANSEVSYLIYFPPFYEKDTTARFPVTYWLHGLNANQRGGAPFVAQVDAAIRAGQAPPMIAVLVNGMRDVWWNDSADGKMPVESVVIKELIPHIDSTYRTIARRESRGVEGYSMGGYGAAHLGFKYPEVFGIVGIIAGGLAGSPQPHIQAATLDQYFGGRKGTWADGDPFLLLRKNADAIRGRTTIRLAVGYEDGFHVHHRALHDFLNELKIEHEHEILPGLAHSVVKWYQTLGPRSFTYYRKALDKR